MNDNIKRTGNTVCGEHQGFGGDCLNEEDIREAWLEYYEVSLCCYCCCCYCCCLLLLGYT